MANTSSLIIPKEHQELVILSVMKDTYMYAIAKDSLRDGYFSDPSCKVIYKAVTVYYSKYGVLPNESELLVMIDEVYYDGVGASNSTIKATAKRLYATPIPDDEKFIKDKITDLVRRSRVGEALQGILDKVSSNDTLDDDGLAQSLFNCMNVELDDAQVFSLDDVSQIREQRQKAIGSEDNPRVIRSCLPTINKNLMYGGWQPATVNMIVSPPGCFTGDTKIMTFDGKSHSLQELYDFQQNNPKFKLGIYGCNPDDSTIVTDLADSIYLSKYTDHLVEVTIDDKYVIRCTEDHPFLTRSDSYVRADKLSIGQSMMSFDKGDHKVTKVEPIQLDNPVPVYGVVDAGRYHNYALALSDSEGIFVSNTGKSTYLVNEGASAAMQGFYVLHVFIGDMREYDGFVRYLSCISATPQSTVALMTVDKQSDLTITTNQQYNEVLSRVKILAYPAYSIDVDNLIEDIRRTEKKLQVDFGMIIIDYPDNLIKQGRSLYDEGGELYAKLEKLSRLTNAVIMTASQPQKCYWSTEIIPLEGASESSRKQHSIDVMITYNKPTRDSTVGSMFLAKVRRGTEGQIIRVEALMSQSRYQEIPEANYRAYVQASGKKGK